MTDLQRDIGRHEEAIDTLKSDVAAIRLDVAEIKDMVARIEGAKLTLRTLGSIVAAVGAAVGALMTKLIEWRGAP